MLTMNLQFPVVCYVMLALVMTATRASLEIVPPLSDLYVVLGSPLWWTCSAVNSGQTTTLNATYRWSLQNGDIPQDNTRIAYSNGTLYFPQVLIGHLDPYTCTVSDSGETNQSSAWLRQAYISTPVIAQPSNQSVALGDTALLECIVDGKPLPQLAWKHNGATVVRSDKVNITDDGPGHSKLQITNSAYTDAGSYTCTASHVTLSQPISSSPADVRVYGKPIITKGPRDQTVPVGYNVTFYCFASSEPKSTLNWTFQSSADPGAVTPLTTSQPSVSIDDVSRSLTLTSVNTSNIGSYSCSWNNEHGTASSQASLVVAGDAQPPGFAVRPSDTSVSEGDVLRLSCNGTGNPTPDIMWVIPDGLTISGISDSTNTIDNNSAADTKWASVDVDGSLILRNVTSDDGGKYICRLINAVAAADSIAIVTVFYKPYYLVLPQSTTVTEGSQFTLTCQAVGNPDPEISWTVPGSSTLNLTSTNSGVNSNNNEIVSQDGNLVVMKANKSHNGVFTCYAFNAIGSSAASATVSFSVTPYFSVIPNSQAAIEGGNVNLQCQASANPAADVRWYYRYITDPSIQSTDITRLRQALAQKNNPPDNMTLARADPNGHLSFNGTSLRFVGVQGSDAGFYVCVANNSLGSAYTSAVLRVITFPKFQVKPTDTKVSLGSTVRLDCFTVGIPIPSQRWVFNQRKVEMDQRKSLYINGSLAIQKIQESDLGNYTCLATNQAGQRSNSAMLTVYIYPSFITPPSNATKNFGGKATLTCRGSSPSPLRISWYVSDSRGNQLSLLGQVIVNQQAALLSDNDNTTSSGTNQIQVSPDGDLLFGCVELSDSMWYMCYLNNTDGGTPSGPVFLTVNDLPVIISTETPQNASLGQSDNITCQARGSPSPIISWVSPLKVEYTETSMGEITVTTGESSMSFTSTLRIQNLQTDRDAGNWTCKACNSVGCRKQKVVLNIEGPPVIRQIIGKELDNDYFISCKSIGKPLPNITYLSKGTAITNLTDGHTVANNDLWVTKDKILSEYACEAVNPYGNQTVLLQTPQSVQILNVKSTYDSFVVSLNYSQPVPSLEPNKIILQFTTNGSNEWKTQTFNLSYNIEDYLDVDKGAVDNNDTVAYCGRNITKRDASLPDDISVSVTVNDTKFVYLINASIHGVVPNTAYVLRAAVGNILGPGEYSPQAGAKTLAQPPSPVTNVMVTVSNRTATVNWTNPELLNGLPNDTSIITDLFNSSSSLTPIATTSVSVLDLPRTIFPSLQPGNYNLNIYVSNRQTSTTSSVVTKAFEVQENPPLFRTNITEIHALDAHTVLINWTTPLNPVLSQVSGYTIEISEEEQNNSLKAELMLNVSEATVQSLKIENLLANTLYSMRVASTNNAGIGPFSDPRNVTTSVSESYAQTSDTASIPWWTSAVIVGVIGLVLTIITVVVIVVHQIRLHRTDSANISEGVESENNEERLSHRSSHSIEGHENRGFVLY